MTHLRAAPSQLWKKLGSDTVALRAMKGHGISCRARLTGSGQSQVQHVHNLAGC